MLCVDPYGNAIVFFFFFFFFHNMGRWIRVPGKAGKIKVLLVFLQIESRLQKSHLTSFYP